MKVVINPDEHDFISQWEKKKKENDALHKKAYRKIKNMCVFAKDKITGQ